MLLVSSRMALAGVLVAGAIVAIATSPNTFIEWVRCLAVAEAVVATITIYTSGVYRAGLAKNRRDATIITMKECVFSGLCMLSALQTLQEVHSHLLTLVCSVIIFTALLIATSIYTKHEQG